MEIFGERINFENEHGYYFNGDCMDGMKEIPDKFFDLAICDPPYGGGSQIVQVEREGLRGGATDWKHDKRARFGGWSKKYHIGNQDRWDVGGEVPNGGYL